MTPSTTSGGDGTGGTARVWPSVSTLVQHETRTCLAQRFNAGYSDETIERPGGTAQSESRRGQGRLSQISYPYFQNIKRRVASVKSREELYLPECERVADESRYSGS